MKREQNKALGSLISFGNGQVHRLKVGYQLSFGGTVLQVEYTLHGVLNDLIIPAGGPAVQRKDALWQTTCFECFFGRQGDSGYWEMNLSPSGDWNLYRFSAYRQGMQEERKVTKLDSDCLINENKMRLRFALPLRSLLSEDLPIRIGLSAILHYTDETKEYLALSHPDEKPDFHNSIGWILSASDS